MPASQFDVGASKTRRIGLYMGTWAHSSAALRYVMEFIVSVGVSRRIVLHPYLAAFTAEVSGAELDF